MDPIKVSIDTSSIFFQMMVSFKNNVQRIFFIFSLYLKKELKIRSDFPELQKLTWALLFIRDTVELMSGRDNERLLPLLETEKRKRFHAGWINQSGTVGH